METLNWSEKGLKDSELEQRLNSLSEDVCYTEADLSGNVLQSVPNLGKHPAFRNLKYLKLGRNRIVEINSENISRTVQVLDLSNNELSQVCNFSLHEQLEELNLSHNRITHIDLRNIPDTTQVFNVSVNKISEVCNFSQHQRLRELNLSSNQITTIDPVDLPCNIQVVKMSSNKISEVCDFSQYQHLIKLDLSSNQITSIDPKNLPCNIQVVKMSSNKISEICKFSEHQHLIKLNLSSNQITTIDPENLPCSIQVVKMSSNKVSEELCSFSQHQCLRKVDLSDNQITSIDPENLPCNVQVVKMSLNRISAVSDFSRHQHLRELDLSANQITNIDPENLPYNIQVVNVSRNKISEVCDFGQHRQLRELHLSRNQITSINPENLPCNIQVVNVDCNEINKMCNFSQHQQLKEVNVSSNQITSTNPENLPYNIQVVKMSNNKISDVCNFSQHQLLRELDLSFNQITSMNPENLPRNIQVVKITHNKITEVCDISKHQELIKLDLSNNQIASIKPENLPCNIQVINMYSNTISKLSNISQHQHLRELHLSQNQISNINPENLPCNIQVINMSWNKINEVCNFSNHQQLRELYLSHNQITSIKPENLPCTIQVVDMSQNKISKVCNFGQHQLLRILHLSDNQITSIDPEGLPRQIQALKMYSNKISQMCNFSEHRHLRELDLSKNQITSLKAENLPCNIQVVKMFSNKINQLCNFSEHQHLKELDLSKNQIPSINPEHLPRNIQVVNMTHNEIRDVCNIRRHQHLIKLDLSHNQIRIIDPPSYIFPCSLEKLVMVNNPITTLGEKLFETQHFCTCAKGDFKSLIQPPRQIYIKGYEAIKSYYTDVRLSKMVQNSRKRLVLLGLTEAGKSSAVESLKEGKAVLVNIRDRTHVIDIKHWDITEEDIIHIYDQGGQSIYSITSPMFISKESTVFLVHDLTKVHQQEIDRMIEILRQALHQYPDNELHVVLTHTDLLSTDQITTNAKTVQAAIQQFLDGEMNSYYKLKEENEGLRASTSELVKMFQQKKTSIIYFMVSSKTYSGMEEVKEFLKEVIKKKRDPVPESWVKFYRRITETTKKFLSLDEAVAFYVEELSKQDQRHSSESDIETDFETLKARALVPLNYFRDSNLVLHYDQNPLLRNYVFHDLEFIIAVFKSVFHHRISDVINYEEDEKVQAKFKKLDCDTAVKQYQNEGLLGENLLSYLWEHHNLKTQDKDTLIELMRSFNLCYNISKDNRLLYFPWFVKSQKCPDHLKKECLMVFDKDCASVQMQCEFYNRIPLNVFEMVCVCLQRKATKESHYMGDRQAWKDGLVVYFGSVECIVTRSVETKSIINICVRGKLDDIPQIWKTIDTLLEDLESVLSQWYGIIKSIHFICGHCVIEGIVPPNHWPPDLVLPKDGKLVPLIVHCSKDPSKDIPIALIAAIFKEEDRKQQRAVADVAQYLETFWKAKNPPGPLPYLDCDLQLPDVYTLSWDRPQEDTGGDIVTNFLVEYRDEANEWKQIPHQTTGKSCKFKGDAFEFRVAAENRNGKGPFIHCEPATAISDEKLSDSDMEEMKQNKEAFLQMSCVERMVIRLACRGGIHTDVGERVLWALNQENGAFRAASRLMEEVYRCNYQQLYLFKKTLAEFGQHHLADLVPVRKHNDPHFAVVQRLPHSSSVIERRSRPGIDGEVQSPGTSRTNLPAEVGESIEHTTDPPISSPGSSERHPVPDDIQPSVSEDVLGEDVEHPSHPPVSSLRSSQPLAIPDDIQARISEDLFGDHNASSSMVALPGTSREQRQDQGLRTEVREGCENRPLQYHLLEELTTEQKNSRPKERLFATIVHHIDSVLVFGIHLGFKRKQVKRFQSENPSSAKDQLFEMLIAWRRKKKEQATVERLMIALQKSDIPEQSYRQAVLDFFSGSDDASDTSESSEN